MLVHCLFLVALYPPLIKAAHQTANALDTGGNFQLPWEQQIGQNEAVTNPFADPSLGETIAAVSPSEVRTLPSDADISSINSDHAAVSPSEVRTLPSDADISSINSDQFNQFPRRHWRRQRPFWRRRQFLNDRIPGWRFEDRSRDLRFGLPETLRGPPTPNHIDHHGSATDVSHNDHVKTNVRDSVIKQHDQVNLIAKSKDQLPTSPKQQLTSKLLQGLGLKDNQNVNKENIKKVSKTNNEKTQEKIPASTNQLGDVLQVLAKKMASDFVDRLVDRVFNNQRQTFSLPGTSSHSMATGSGFSQPFVPVAHTHGPNGEVIPMAHADHVHSPQGHAIPVTNPAITRFGQRNRWAQNPFLHPATQGRSRGGWMVG